MVWELGGGASSGVVLVTRPCHPFVNSRVESGLHLMTLAIALWQGNLITVDTGDHSVLYLEDWDEEEFVLKTSSSAFIPVLCYRLVGEGSLNINSSLW
ncbi:hypothetical protein TNCV_70291 [Trichonephila clavipes]|nr:hypothetical protein TNCV_70291 [Trichonephila clavipes]